jgi:uridylate kinase
LLPRPDSPDRAATTLSEPAYRRILLKLSGEALQGDQGFGISLDMLEQMASEVRQVRELAVDVAIVVGGGNIYRGMSGAAKGMDRSQADTMGMLATVMNALALQDAFERAGMPTRVQSALSMHQVAEPYIRRRAVRHLEKGRVVVFAAGTGNPYFTTDTAAALRAMEVGADVLLKATKVDGVYDKDPVHHADAVRYDGLSHQRVLNEGLKVMDATAVTMCMENDLPIVVFNLFQEGALLAVVHGKNLGTRVDGVGR